MALKILGIEKKPSDVTINRVFEAMGDNLLLVTLEVLPLRSNSPHHWFLENNKKPPFDIAINPQNSVLNYIKFFFQDEKLSRKNNTLICVNSQNGLPIFDISNYSEKVYQRFEEGDVEAYIADNCLFLISGDAYSCSRIYMDEKNALLVDCDGTYSGLMLGSLSEEEFNELVVAKIL
jgi:hypothetical protein